MSSTPYNSSKTSNQQLKARLEAVREQLDDLENANELSSIFRAVLDATDNTITITDPRLPDNPLIYVNQEFQRLTGYKTSEVEGQNCRFLQGDDRNQKDLPRLREAIKGGHNCRVELRNYRKNGEMFWNELYLTAVYNKQSELIAFYGVQNDITRFKELAELERRRSMELTLAEYRERSRIAQRLHDGLQQDLYALQFSLTNFQRQLGDTETSAELGDILEQIQDAIQTTRHVTSSLDSPALEEKDLKEALSWMIKRMRDRHGLNARFHAPNSINYLNDTLRVLVISLIRELLFNVVKHANKLEAEVTVIHNEDGVGIVVSDQGTGFKLDELSEANGTGLGLTGIRDRLKIFGGELEVETALDQGTRVSIQIPV
ncbi:MAG: PAS domain-containing protein [Trueperaceae bacterium]|nr:PAS domain-containing protein [Trueperaceae bacterium]